MAVWKGLSKLGSSVHSGDPLKDRGAVLEPEPGPSERHLRFLHRGGTGQQRFRADQSAACKQVEPHGLDSQLRQRCKSDSQRTQR